MARAEITPQSDPHLFIPGTAYLKPTIDVIFKMLMTANAAARKSFLTAILRPNSPIESTEVLNPEILPCDIFGKTVRLDVRVKLCNGAIVDIEMQTTHDDAFAKRAIFYTSKLAADLLNKGEDYKTLPDICGIFIFNTVQFPQFPEAHSSFELARNIPPDGKLLQAGILRLDFLELPKVNASLLKENWLLWNWSQFFAPESPKRLKQAVKNVPELNMLEKELKIMSADIRTRQLAQERESDRRIAELAMATSLEMAREKGKADGEVIGEAKGAAKTSRTVAQNMLADGLPRATVCRYLNITDPELTVLLASPAPTND